MLVLTRRKDESIIIEKGISVTILGIDGEKVKIGIDAPDDIKIYREEIYQALIDQSKIKETLIEEIKDDKVLLLRELLIEEINEHNVQEE